MINHSFLRCENCSKWGQPFRRGRKVILCENETDEKGVLYNPNHPACVDFVPLQGSYTKSLEILKLFVQSLSDEDKSQLLWAFEQSENLIGRADCQGNTLALGDFVAFKWVDNMEYAGIVEGADDKGDVIRIFCPAFPTSGISLVEKSLRKISAQEAKVLAKQKLSEFMERGIAWHLECLADELEKFKEKENLTPDEYQQYLDCCLRWSECDARLKYNLAISQLLK